MTNSAPRSPYRGLPRRAFWKSVADRGEGPADDLYRPRFEITRKTAIFTAGSCFAQHIGQSLRRAGCRIVDTEAMPDMVPETVARRFGYRQYSARYGNIYTPRQLRQLLGEIDGTLTPAYPVWVRDGRFFDALRPAVEPEGLETPDLVAEHRRLHLARARSAFARGEVFVFTLGLTEAWIHRESGTVYPTAPGTIAGAHDPEVFAFHNFSFAEVIEDLHAIRAQLQARQPGMRMVLTVSPVALTATASDAHVEVATSYSKAVLRAAAGQMMSECADVDYFPSYEIVTSRAARGRYLSADLRDVTPAAVEDVMQIFFAAHGIERGDPADHATTLDDLDAPVCEDLLLEAFGR
ncbi:MAG: GSCFA domain-containing protein [Pseudomonadota bacterium]